MARCRWTALLALFLMLGAGSAHAADGLRQFEQVHRTAILRFESAAEAQTYLETHLFDGYGKVNALVGFMDALTGGVYQREVDYLLKEKILSTVVDSGSLASVDRMQAHLMRIRQNRPLTVNISAAMARLASHLTAYTLAAQVCQALEGDDAARVAALATAVNARLGWLAEQVGTRAMGVAMGGVAFIDYALKSFIAEQYAQYEAFWWNAYVAYFEKKYPHLVTGRGSWAALLDTGGGEGITRRLHEFWEAPLENAATYYRTPSPFQREALAAATFRTPFAARYYTDYLKQTLETYVARQVRRAETDNWIAAEAAYERIRGVLPDLVAIRKAVQMAEEALRAEREAGASRAAIPMMATLGTYDGPPLRDAVRNGDILAFQATLPPVSGSTGRLTAARWQVFDEAGRPLPGLEKRTEIFQNGEPTSVRFRFRLDQFENGTYQVRMNHEQRDGGTASRLHQGTASFRVYQPLMVDRLLVTDDAGDQRHHPVLPEGRDALLYAHYRLPPETDQVELTLRARRVRDGALLEHATVTRPRPGERPPYRVGLKVPAGKLHPGERCVFDLTAAVGDTTGAASSISFRIADPSPRSGSTEHVALQQEASADAPYSVEPPEESGPSAGAIVQVFQKPSAEPTATASDSRQRRREQYAQRVREFQADWVRSWQAADAVLGKVNAFLKPYLNQLQAHLKAGSAGSYSERRRHDDAVHKMADPWARITAFLDQLPDTARKVSDDQPKAPIRWISYFQTVTRGIPGFDQISYPKKQMAICSAEGIIFASATYLKYYRTYVSDMLSNARQARIDSWFERVRQSAADLNALGKAFESARHPPPVPDFDQKR